MQDCWLGILGWCYSFQLRIQMFSYSIPAHKVTAPIVSSGKGRPYRLGFSPKLDTAVRNDTKSAGWAVRIQAQGHDQSSAEKSKVKECLQCGRLYRDEENAPSACKYHGHMTGDRGLYASAPPHQGIDGEWSEASGVIVYKWNRKGDRPNTGSRNWQSRWTCCGVYDVEAPPCRSGWHVSYDDGHTRF